MTSIKFINQGRNKMRDVEKALNEELETIKLHDDFDLRKNIGTLCYSAEETGMLPCR